MDRDPIFGFDREQWLDYAAHEVRHGWLSDADRAEWERAAQLPPGYPLREENR